MQTLNPQITASQLFRPQTDPTPLQLFVSRLTREGVLRAHQALEIVERQHESVDERWASPFLRDVREHTRAYVDALCRASTHRHANQQQE